MAVYLLSYDLRKWVSNYELETAIAKHHYVMNDYSLNNRMTE